MILNILFKTLLLYWPMELTDVSFKIYKLSWRMLHVAAVCSTKNEKQKKKEARIYQKPQTLRTAAHCGA